MFWFFDDGLRLERVVRGCSKNKSLVWLRGRELNILPCFLLNFLALSFIELLLPQLIKGLLNIFRLLRLLIIDGRPLVAHVVLPQIQILLWFVKLFQVHLFFYRLFGMPLLRSDLDVLKRTLRFEKPLPFIIVGILIPPVPQVLMILLLNLLDWVFRFLNLNFPFLHFLWTDLRLEIVVDEQSVLFPLLKEV